MSAARTKAIVIVDDDDGVRDSTRVLLESYGYSTECFESAEVFLEKTEGRVGDCLLVEVQMPGMSGIKLLEHLRARGIQKPVILMTANVERLGDRAAQVGALAILRKPFSEDALLEAIALVDKTSED